MKATALNMRHLSKVVATWTSIVYTVCYAGVALYPPIRTLFMRYALHANVSFASDYLGFGYFLSGLVIWNAVALFAVGLFVALYNSIEE
ncbi:MAG: hypothetical protein ACD_78C00257G0002 [uncultured bacterium (gcode 4)]|uniref:Uncharacterized protein n=1 Tax=uncultured bacterium (gcode 4) TaxID=1234023 RepID=K1XXW3_9BACT|nr:MAG: hypothetical protein ACD_78C00257G0002 [uncultured bacterium (gcode 4)]